jgi:hypothetical protein
MGLQLTYAPQFFAMCRERYNIKLRRDAGQTWPWSANPIFQTWRFTNVFREDDRTTIWLRENVRGPLSDLVKADPSSEAKRLKLVESTVIFRWINRISTAELIKDLLLEKWDTEEARRRLKDVHPLVTGAYMLKYENGVSKLTGVLLAIDGARRQLPSMVPKWGDSLEAAWKDLRHIWYMGGFTAHEVIQDLNHTAILDHATDSMTWGFLGPGAIRGMSWVVYGNEHSFHNSKDQQKLMLGLMQELLAMSQDPQYWPSEFPPWRLHQVEFSLCEMSKFCKAGAGIPQKRRYQRP